MLNKYVVNNIEYDQLVIPTTIGQNQYIIKTSQSLDKKYIVCISNQGLRITDCEVNKENVSLNGKRGAIPRFQAWGEAMPRL